MPIPTIRAGAGALLAVLAISGDPSDANAQGRGRGGIRVMTLTSAAFQSGGTIPDRHAQPGHDVSPPLAWSGAPDSTVSFVLIVRDADAVSGDGTVDALHWMVWGIPGTATSLPEGVPQGPQLNYPDMTPAVAGGGGRGGGRGGAPGSGVIRQLSVSGPYYRGPAAPATGPPHHYVFELYALDTNVNVNVGLQSSAQVRQAVWDAMRTRIRGKATLVGLYRRPAP